MALRLKQPSVHEVESCCCLLRCEEVSGRRTGDPERRNVLLPWPWPSVASCSLGWPSVTSWRLVRARLGHVIMLLTEETAGQWQSSMTRIERPARLVACRPCSHLLKETSRHGWRSVLILPKYISGQDRPHLQLAALRFALRAPSPSPTHASNRERSSKRIAGEKHGRRESTCWTTGNNHHTAATTFSPTSAKYHEHRLIPRASKKQVLLF